jgi:hypothetical protein
MKKNRTLIYIIIVLCAVGFLLTISDFLALTDIYHDFIGTRVQEQLGVTIGTDLPEWTAAKGEWGLLRVGYIFRFLFFVFSAAVLTKLANNLGRT